MGRRLRLIKKQIGKTKEQIIITKDQILSGKPKSQPFDVLSLFEKGKFKRIKPNIKVGKK